MKYHQPTYAPIFWLYFVTTVNKICNFIPSFNIMEKLKCKFLSRDNGNELFLWDGWPTNSRQPWLQKGSSSGSFTIVNFQHSKIRIDPGSPKQKSLVLPHFLEYCIETWKKLYPFLHSWGLGLGTNGLLQVNVKDVFMFNGNLCLSWVTKTSLRFSVLLTFLVP